MSHVGVEQLFIVQDCPNILRLHEKERLVRVAWGEPKRTYPVFVRVKAYDRDGLARDVSNLVANEGINMGLVQAGVNHDSKLSLAILDLVLEVKDVDQLTRVLTQNRSITKCDGSPSSKTWLIICFWGNSYKIILNNLDSKI